MNTKKAIKFCVDLKRLAWNMYFEEYTDKEKQQYLEGVIKLLQRGKKYEQMWENFKKKYGNYWGAFDVRKNHSNITYIADLIDKFKQKYFPKGDKNE